MKVICFVNKHVMTILPSQMTGRAPAYSYVNTPKNKMPEEENICKRCNNTMSMREPDDELTDLCHNCVYDELDEIRENAKKIAITVERLLSSHSIGTSFVAGRYICIECGARSTFDINIIGQPPTHGAFDYVRHTDDCLFERLIDITRKYL